MDGTAQGWQDPKTGERFVSNGQKTVRESRMDPEQFEVLWRSVQPEKSMSRGAALGTLGALGLAALHPTTRVVGGLAAGAAMLHPKSRAAISERARSLWDALHTQNATAE